MLASYVARLALVGAGSLRRGRADPLEPLRVPLRIWPSDIDVYGHLNNGRYLTLMDFGRLDHALRTGLFKAAVQRRWVPVAGAATVRFRRELTPFSRAALVSRLAHWDEKWFVFEHRLEDAHGLCAQAWVRCVVKHGRETIAPGRLLEAGGFPAASPPPSKWLAGWLALLDGPAPG